MADVVRCHSRRVAACVLVLLYVYRRRRNRKRWQNNRFGRWSVQHALSRASRLLTPVSPLVLPFSFHRSGQFWTSSMNWKVARSSSHPSAILWSVMQITWIERVFWLVDSHQHTFANRSHVYQHEKVGEKIGENRGKLYLSPTVYQLVCRLFLSRSHTLTWVGNTSLPTLVCRVKAALVV